MAVEKGKVLAKLELKYKGKSISKTFKENLAAKWADKIENDEDIDAYIDERDELILEAVSEADRRATDATKKATEQKQDPPKNEDQPKNDDAPDWFKSMQETMQKLQEKVEGYEQKETAKTIENRFRNDERLKGVPEFILKRAIPKNEDEFEANITELATEWQGLNKEGYGKDNPGFSDFKTQQNGKADNDIANFAKKQNESFINEKN